MPGFILLFLIIIIGLSLIVGGRNLANKALGCIFAPVKAFLKVAFIILVIVFAFLFFIKRMAGGPIMNYAPSPTPHQPSGSPGTGNNGNYLPTPSSVYKPPLPGDEWSKEEIRPEFWYVHNQKYGGNVDVHSFIINLTSPDIHFKTLLAGNSSGRQGTSEMAKSNGAMAAINGDYFGNSRLLPEGLTIVKGKTYCINPEKPEYPGRSAIVFGKTGPAGTKVEIDRWKDLSGFAEQREDWMYNAVGGGPIFLIDGNYCYNILNEDFTPPNLSKYENTQYRRSIAALTGDKKALILLSADGPLTGEKSSELVRELGGYRAMFLDSGGSSTIYIEGRGILNNPSDGTERKIPDAIGIFYVK